MARMSVWVLLGLALFTFSVHDLHVKADIPTEYECRPYIEKALQDLKTETDTLSSKEDAAQEEPSSQESPIDVTSQEEDDNTAAEETSIEEDAPSTPEELTPSEEVQEALFDESTDQAVEASDEALDEVTEDDNDDDDDDDEEEDDEETDDEAAPVSDETEPVDEETTDSQEEADEDEEAEETASAEAEDGQDEDEQEDDTDADDVSAEADDDENAESVTDSQEDVDENDDEETEDSQQDQTVSEEAAADNDDDDEVTDSQEVEDDDEEDTDEERSEQDVAASEETDGDEEDEEDNDTKDGKAEVSSTEQDEDDNEEDGDDDEDDKEDEEPRADEAASSGEVVEETSTEVLEDDEDDEEEDDEEETENEEAAAAVEGSEEVEPEETASGEDTESDVEEATASTEAETEQSAQEAEPVSEETTIGEEASEETIEKTEAVSSEAEPGSEQVEATEEGTEETQPAEEQQEQSVEESEPLPEEDLLLEYEIPSNRRDISHVYELLNINEEETEKEKSLQRVADIILRDLKRIYDTAIKPLETLYKYRDLSNRHFGDPEIFSKPLILFMGPWSGGKSTILNYLTHNEYTPNSIRTGAEPSPAYFNILMHGNDPEVLDGTQLAADWTFSGLQKFGQGLLDRLRGQKLPNKLLERVNIVEIPGILEVRKQVSQYFPFNDACQWFIDRADIIFLVYDPSKLDVGPETEAILDQLKGREYQTRILLNKADQVKPEELLRVQGALIWNISPLMSSAQPPIMYTVSLWSNPFETGAPVRLLQAQERSMLLDLGTAIDKRIENKIASARRFAVRVRNHAKMVDCYLTTYYNHKTLFANKKHITEQIIGNPQQYHIYEGLSTLTNISRYDLPDPESYRDFFHLNPLYEFKKLSDTCTYFRGCPINKLDIAIAYDLPELVGKYKKLAEEALEKLHIPSPTTDFGRGKSSS